MSGRTYAIGVDFGTESGRAVLVDCADGSELGVAVHGYRNGVIDEHLPEPDADVRLEPDWALQDPEDYVRTFQETIPDAAGRDGRRPDGRDRRRHRLHLVHDAADARRRDAALPAR